MRIRLAVIAALTLCLAACGQKADEPWLGYAEGEDAFVAAPQPGWVDTLAIHRGDAVKIGQLLFTLDETQQAATRDQTKAILAQANAQVAQLQAQLEYASKELARQKAVYAAHAGTKAQLDIAQNAYDAAVAQVAQNQALVRSAEANLASADYQLSQRQVVARTNGRVEDIYFRTGEYVPAATPVLSVLPPQNVFVRFFVPEKDFARLKLGQRVRIACDGCAGNLTATITFIAQQEEFTPPVIFSIANRDKLVFKAEARSEGGLALNPGQPVDVTPLR